MAELGRLSGGKKNLPEVFKVSASLGESGPGAVLQALSQPPKVEVCPAVAVSCTDQQLVRPGLPTTSAVCPLGGL